MSDALTRLFTLPLSEFTAARNALAKELSAAGDKEAAAEVKALKKPNLAAWAVNQVVHAHGIDELLEATEALRRAQRKVMGGGRGTELREMTDRRNRVVADLTKRAKAILEEADHATATTTMAAVSDTFMAVASDEEELLRAGRLVRELKPRAVVDVGALHLVSGEEEAEAATERPADRERVTEARAELSRAREAAKKARKTAWEAEGDAERLAQAAKEVEQTARAAREEAEFAKRAAEARRAEHDEAEREVERLEAELDSLRG